MILTPAPTGGQQILRHALVRRWKSIAACTLIGALVGVLAALFIPVSHTATTTVTVTGASATPAPVARTSLTTTDMVTEEAVVRSANVLESVAKDHGKGRTSIELRDNLDVSGDTDGTIVKISFTSKTRQDAVLIADAITASYLAERTALTRQRAEEMAEIVNEQVETLGEQLAGLDTSSDSGRAAADAIQQEIRTLNEQSALLEPYHVVSGRVLTSADQSRDIESPEGKRLVMITTVIGLFVGLVTVVLQETRQRRVRSASHLADLTALPVWGIDEDDAANPWSVPASMITLAFENVGDVDLIAHASDPQAQALHRALAESFEAAGRKTPAFIDSSCGLASLLESISDSRRVLVGVREGDDLGELHRLLDRLAMMNREAQGLVILGPQLDEEHHEASSYRSKQGAQPHEHAPSQTHRRSLARTALTRRRMKAQEK
ncbi:Wzz/FepE/Etk N-terminal domain-containing protein [Schaalia vaccimaxillae]|uniref:Wzz/FepE/Etk N-terminal domain-containing protein n=1 Tax=Schaalia vaccimaxillae TaxID=183916 RepID=UPI0003B67ECB|nr:Wzz/FepE/Etk N-terminal domain-containing protein [Schaalia vaccimaxillae]